MTSTTSMMTTITAHIIHVSLWQRRTTDTEDIVKLVRTYNLKWINFISCEHMQQSRICALYNPTVMKQRAMQDSTHTHPFNGLCPGLPGWASTRKVKPVWILLKQETVSGSGINWAICKSASRSRQITMPAPHHSVFTGQMPFLSPNQQRQSTEGMCCPCRTALNNKNNQY